MQSFVANCPLIVLKSFDLRSAQNVFHDLPFISGLYKIFFKSKTILDLLNPPKLMQIYSNLDLGTSVLESLSEVYLKSVEKFASPKFGYSVWKLSMLREKSKLSASMNQDSLLSRQSQSWRRKRLMNPYPLFSIPLSVILFVPFKIFNFLTELLGLNQFDAEDEHNKFFERERVMDRNFQVELFKDQFKDDLKQIGSLWGYSHDQTEQVFKNTQKSLIREKGLF